MADYFTIARACEAELRVKDSRFISWVAPAASREQAEDLIAQRSRRFAGATHNCFAWRVGSGAQLLARAYDANEPAGTAGRPMLRALEARRVTNVAAVVARYFGGTKLGTGGLIRAYSGAMFAVLDAATLLSFFETLRFSLVYQYPDSGAVDKAMRKFGATVMEEKFGAEIRRVIEIRKEHEVDFQRTIEDLSAGRVDIQAI